MVVAALRRTQTERRDGAEKRLLEAGTRLVVERGLRDLTLAEVGAAAGFSRGLPAHHFGSKSNFQKKLVSFIIREYRNGIQRKSENSGLAALMDIVSSFLELSTNDLVYSCVMQIVLSNQPDDLELSRDIAILRKEMLDMFERLIREGVKKGEIRHDVDPKYSSLLINSVLCDVKTWFDDPSVDIAVAGDELTRFIRNALESR